MAVEVGQSQPVGQVFGFQMQDEGVVVQLKDAEVEHFVLIAKGVGNGMVAFGLPLMIKEKKYNMCRWCLVGCFLAYNA